MANRSLITAIRLGYVVWPLAVKCAKKRLGNGVDIIAVRNTKQQCGNNSIPNVEAEGRAQATHLRFTTDLETGRTTIKHLLYKFKNVLGYDDSELRL